MKSNFKITKLVALLLAMIFAMSAMTGCSSSSNTTETKAEDTNDDSTASETQVVIDSIGREVEIPDPVTKAVVANAYNTEIINAIDALDCVIGVDYNIYQDKESWKNKFTEDMVIKLIHEVMLKLVSIFFLAEYLS